MAGRVTTRTPVAKGAHVTLLLEYITRQGGVAPVSTCIKRYGELVVQHCIETKRVKTARLKWVDKTNRVPPVRIDAIHTDEWKKERPTWLDDYIAR